MEAERESLALGAARAGPRASPAWWPWSLLALFAVALGWKLYCLQRHFDSPLLGHLGSDSETYWRWSQAIVRGGWLGSEPFFLGPLYPYWLALWQPVSKTPFAVPLLAQCVLGGTTVVLVALTASRLCGRGYALGAGVLAASYSMATFMDISLLSESLLWFLGSVCLHLEVTAVDTPPRKGHSMLSGLLIGLMTLGRPSFALLAVPYAALRISRHGLRRGAMALLLAVSGAALVLVPVLYRHVRLGHGWIVSTYSLGYNTFIGNGPHATGGYVGLIDEQGAEGSGERAEGGTRGDGRAYVLRTEGLRLSPLESSSYWLKRTWEQVVRAPLNALRLLVWKAALSLNHSEMPQVDSLRARELIEGPLGAAWLGAFGVIGSLGLFGLIASRGTAGGQALLLFALTMWAPLVLFFVTDRYRHHLALPLLVACGPALEAGVAALRRDGLQRVQPARPLLVGVSLVIVVWLPLLRLESVQAEFQAHQTLGEALVEKGRFADGELELRKCLEPAVLRRLPLHESTSARTAVGYVWHALAGSYAARGEYHLSEAALRTGLGYAPQVRAIRLDHAVVLALCEHPAEARAQMDTLALPVAVLGSRLLDLARAAAETSALPRTEQALKAAILVDSTSEAANVVLLRLLLGQGREAEAHRHCAKLARRGIHPSVLAREAGQWTDRSTNRDGTAR